MNPELTCLNCLHYSESQRECHGWDRPAPVQDPAATARTCRRYTDIYGREVEFVEGQARFKQAADVLEAAKQVVKAAITAKQEVDTVAQTAQATHERPRRRLPLRRPDVSDEQIRELWQQGKPTKEIARTVNMSPVSVRNRLRRLGLRPATSEPPVTAVPGSAAQTRVAAATATSATTASEVVISAERQAIGISVEVRVQAGITLSDLLDVLKAIGGAYAANWRVQPVAFRLARDEAAR